MKKSIMAVTLFLLLALMNGCTEKQAMEPTPTSKMALSNMPAIEVYAGVDEFDIVEQEMLALAYSYQSLYESLDKGTAFNAVISDEGIAFIMEHIAGYGHTVTAFDNNMLNHEAFEDFIMNARDGKAVTATYYRVQQDGGFVRFNYESYEGRLYVNTAAIEWSDEQGPEVKYYGNYSIIDEWEYTDKGFLVYQTNHSPRQYALLRVKPLKAAYRALCDKYISPVGYQGNNLLLVEWDQYDMEQIAFNDLYETLLYIDTGKWTDYDLFATSVSAEAFEPLFTKYFGVSNDFLRKNAIFYEEENVYFWNSLTCGKHYVLFPAPEPEVVDSWDNGDGTITMVVDALDMHKGWDRAFTHEVTVKVFDDGSFQYISNKIWPESALRVPPYTPRWEQPF